MFNAQSECFLIYRLRLVLIAIISLSAFFHAKSQPPPSNPNQPLRVAIYRTDFILGYAPAGSIVNLYYATNVSPCVKVPNSIPFKTLTADESNTWAYTSVSEAPVFGPFLAPVVVSYIKPGTTTEVFESFYIGTDELRVSENDCSGRATISMIPGVSESAIIWKDQSGAKAGEGNYINLSAGTYTMEYTNRHGCLYKSVPVTVYSAAPTVQGTEVSIPCGQQTVTLQGQFQGEATTFLWERQSDGQPVSQNRQAVLPAGKYYFSAMAQGGCWSNKAEVLVNPAPATPQINSIGMQRRDADCGQKNGYIIGVTASISGNAQLTYIWTDSKGNEFSGQNLVGAGPEIYTLQVSAAGSPCTASFGPVEIKETNGINLIFTAYNAAESATSCGQNNGKITGFIAKNANVFKWYKLKNDGSGEYDGDAVSNTIDLTGASPGYYALVLSNTNTDCVYSQTFHIPEGSPAIKVFEEPIITDDNCGLGTGSITGIRFNTSIKKYTWLDAGLQKVGETADLRGVVAGVYTLLAESDKCESPFTFTIAGTSTSIPAPVIADILVCAPGTVQGSFEEPSPLYRVYNEEGTLVSQRTDKNFSILVKQSSVYYGALANGDCESLRTPFRISFGSSGLQIPSVFSPNGDGQNDTWIIKGIDNYQKPDVKIFNRQGIEVFHSSGKAMPFDGRKNKSDLPVGVYYYVVKPSEECPAQTGSLMLIR